MTLSMYEKCLNFLGILISLGALIWLFSMVDWKIVTAIWILLWGNNLEREKLQ